MYLTSIILPDSLLSIGSNTFQYNILNTITIPKNVTYIGDYAFANNLSLNTAIFINNYIVPSINIFAGDIYLYSIVVFDIFGNTTGWSNYTAWSNIPINIVNFTLNQQNNTIISFNSSLNNLTTLIILSNIDDHIITSIGNSLFINNSLISLNIGNNITNIGDSAFKNNKLVELFLPDTISIIGNYTFSNNSKTISPNFFCK